MTQVHRPPPPKTLCSPTGPAPSACRRSPAIKPEHFRPAFDARVGGAPRRDRRHRRRSRRRPPSPTPSRRWRRAGATLTGSPMCSSCWPAPTPATRSRRSSATSRRCSPATATRCISTGRSMPASPTSMPGAMRSASTPSRRACSTAITPASCAPAARWTSRRQDRLAAINERLASLGTQFGQNVLADEKSYALMLEEGDLAGLPDFARAAARAAAQERGEAGKYAITLARSSCEGFLQFSARRDLREKVFQAWIKRGENGGRDRQPRAHRRDGGIARRAGKAARLCDLCRLPARRPDGQDAGRRANAAGRGLGPGAGQGRGRARRAAEDDRAGGRQFRASRRGTGAITPRSCARPNSTSMRPRSSRTSSSTR